MVYKNAKDVLPEALLKEIQKYSDGEVLYIPAKSQKAAWGGRNGAALQYKERNDKIRSMYTAESCSCEELADRFYLSVDSIKKIIRN